MTKRDSIQTSTNRLFTCRQLKDDPKYHFSFSFFLREGYFKKNLPKKYILSTGWPIPFRLCKHGRWEGKDKNWFTRLDHPHDTESAFLLRISLKGSSEDPVYCGLYIYYITGRPSVSKNGILVKRSMSASAEERVGWGGEDASRNHLTFFEYFEEHFLHFVFQR